MQKFLKYNIEVPSIEYEDKNRARLKIKPLEVGFGTTLGNTLRRICLSSIQGSAIFAVRFYGYSHEFDSIPGIKEDITNINLNLKNLVIKIDTNILDENYWEDINIESWPVLKIKYDGSITNLDEKIIKAQDISCPAGIEIINKDLVITHVTSKDVKLEVDIYARPGRGRVSFDINKDPTWPREMIPTDSNFSPVTHYAWSVQEVKDSKSSLSEELTIDVTTNGVVSGLEAISMAAKILQDHLQPIVEIDQKIKDLITMQEQKKDEKRVITSISIDDLDLTVRAYNALKQANVTTTAEIVQMTKTQLENIKNLGRKSVNEIIDKIHERGLELKKEN